MHGHALNNLIQFLLRVPFTGSHLDLHTTENMLQSNINRITRRRHATRFSQQEIGCLVLCLRRLIRIHGKLVRRDIRYGRVRIITIEISLRRLVLPVNLPLRGPRGRISKLHVIRMISRILQRSCRRTVIIHHEQTDLIPRLETRFRGPGSNTAI